MRVLLVCDGHFRYAVPQAVGLRSAGAQVKILCRAQLWEFRGDAQERKLLATQAEAHGVEVLQLPAELRDPAGLLRVVRFRKMLSRWKPDVVHVHDRAEPRLLACIPRVPVVITIHDPVAHPGQPHPKSRATRALIDWSTRHWRQRAEIAVVHSAALKAELLEVDEIADVCILPHGVDVAEAAAALPAHAVVGFFGRMEAYKGIEVLERAMQIVWSSRTDVSLIIAGTGPVETTLVHPRFERVGGYLPNASVPELLRRFSILVLPYTQASQSGVGSMAVGLGIPIIVSRLGGLPDLALNDDYIVEPRNAQALADALLRHIDDGPEVRESVLEKLGRPRSWRAVGQEALQIYELAAGRLSARPEAIDGA